MFKVLYIFKVFPLVCVSSLMGKTTTRLCSVMAVTCVYIRYGLYGMCNSSYLLLFHALYI